MIPEWKQRLGFFEEIPLARYIWVHCASVGEARLATVLIKEISKTFPEHRILLSVITPAGYKIARQENFPVERVFFLPLDLPFLMAGVVKKIMPEMLILVETELWPGLIKHAKKSGAKIVMVNGRISQKSYRIYRLLKPFAKNTLNKIDLFLMREPVDGQRIARLGAAVSKIHVTGNMKYDQILDNKILSSIKDNVSKKDFMLDEKDRVFTAGSVREGEEKQVIDVCEVLRNKYPRMKFIIAPRHKEQFEKVGRLLKKRNFPYLRKSKMNVLIASKLAFNYIVLDTFGELMKAYSISDVVFVGGTLLPYGGQNIIEPAGLGKPVLFGRYTENFLEPAQVLKDSGGAIEVRDSFDLAENLIQVLKDKNLLLEMGNKAKAAVLAMIGATNRNLEHIRHLMPADKIQNILMIQPSRIGDVIFSLPVLVNLKKLYPDSRISWLVDDRCSQLLEGNTLIDRIIIFPFKKLKISSPVKVMQELNRVKNIFKQEKYDLSIDLHGLAKSAVMAYLAKAKWRIASPSTYGMKELSWMFSKQLPAPEGEAHTIDRHLEVIKYLGNPGTKIIKEFPLVTSKEDRIYVDKLLDQERIDRNKKIIAVMAGGGWVSRRWAGWRFAELCDKLIQNHAVEVCFIGGKPGGSPEDGIVEGIMALMKKKAHNLRGLLTLKQLVEFFKASSLYLGNETGPMHLACALGVNVVAIIGPTNPSRTGPFGDKFTIVRKPQPCAPCKERNCPDIKCMENIQVEDVYRAAEEVLTR